MAHIKRDATSGKLKLKRSGKNVKALGFKARKMPGVRAKVSHISYLAEGGGEIKVVAEDDLHDVAIFDKAKAEEASITLSSAQMRKIICGELHPLTAWRNAAGMTQGQLADAAGGIRPATVSDIESGKIDPRVSTIVALASALGVDVDNIIPDCFEP